MKVKVTTQEIIAEKDGSSLLSNLHFEGEIHALKIICSIIREIKDYRGICRLSPDGIKMTKNTIYIAPSPLRRDVLYPNDGFTASELKRGCCTVPEKAIVYSEGALLFLFCRAKSQC
ncbi:MAG: hypothetical protein ACI4JY_02530 [Oscillospiraceae bacterium]